MLTFWCGVRILYVTVAIRIWPVYNTIAWAYPLTWSLSSIVFLIFLLRSDWTHAFEKKEAKA
jgi:Na+-driven multidrug efflux pump